MGTEQGKGIDAIPGLRELTMSPEYREALALPARQSEEYFLLARGEYNINFVFTHPVTREKMVLRVNTESQMHLDDQIGYEAGALRILEKTGRTPELRFLDDSGKHVERGALVMSFIEGEHLCYGNMSDMTGAAECLADIHSLHVPAEHGLMIPEDPLKAILDECESMFDLYWSSPMGDDAVKSRIRDLLVEGWKRVGRSGSYGGYRCCVNTELNNTNFIVDRAVHRVSLVDWEKPLYSDPAQDLGHFLAPTTTFWKTDVIFDDDTIGRFFGDYAAAVHDRFDMSGLRERTREYIVITCLRGMTWCAMAWIQYRDAGKAIMNESTRVKLDAYLSDSFISRIESIYAAG